MLKDAVDFVRQGAFISTALILQQATAVQEPKVDLNGEIIIKLG
jgi:hypothetical protein